MMKVIDEIEEAGGPAADVDGSTPGNFSVDNVDSTRPKAAVNAGDTSRVWNGTSVMLTLPMP